VDSVNPVETGIEGRAVIPVVGNTTGTDKGNIGVATSLDEENVFLEEIVVFNFLDIGGE
jgi:hypothetical protein